MNFSKEGTTSVRVNHAPGGKSNFSLAWDTEPVKPTNPKHVPIASKPAAGVPGQVGSSSAGVVYAPKTSVKVHNPPGGKSNIVFG
jgi:hypothetical protein